MRYLMLATLLLAAPAVTEAQVQPQEQPRTLTVSAVGTRRQCAAHDTVDGGAPARGCSGSTDPHHIV
jgi:hypothetical protein